MIRIKTIGVAVACMLIAGGVVGVTVALSHKYFTGETAGQCVGVHAKHTIAIQNDTITPAHTNAAVCDTLTITNLDDKRRLMAFGTHDHHTAYDGVSERVLNKGESLTVTLDKSGTFIVHDHYEDEAEATFSVTN
jgi:plastocyanin